MEDRNISPKTPRPKKQYTLAEVASDPRRLKFCELYVFGVPWRKIMQELSIVQSTAYLWRSEMEPAIEEIRQRLWSRATGKLMAGVIESVQYARKLLKEPIANPSDIELKKEALKFFAGIIKGMLPKQPLVQVNQQINQDNRGSGITPAEWLARMKDALAVVDPTLADDVFRDETATSSTTSTPAQETPGHETSVPCAPPTPVIITEAPDEPLPEDEEQAAREEDAEIAQEMNEPERGEDEAAR